MTIASRKDKPPVEESDFKDEPASAESIRTAARIARQTALCTPYPLPLLFLRDVMLLPAGVRAAL